MLELIASVTHTIVAFATSLFLCVINGHSILTIIFYCYYGRVLGKMAAIDSHTIHHKY